MGFHCQILGGEGVGMAPVRFCWILAACPWGQCQLAQTEPPLAKVVMVMAPLG